MKNSQQSAVLLRYLAIVLVLSVLLYAGRTLFVPMAYGLLIAIVMFPVSAWLEKHRIPRSVAVGISLTVVILLFLLLVWLLVWQVQAFEMDWPELRAKIGPSLADFQQWLEKNTGIGIGAQDAWLESQKSSASNAAGYLPGVIRSVSNSLFILFIIPVFTALFLYNRGTFVKFLQLLAGDQYKKALEEVLLKTVRTYFNYIKGLILVYIIVGALNSVGLLLLGVRHAILFGFLTAVMTMIPYIGIIVSALLPISISWIDTGSIWTPLGVVAVFSFVQYLEANVIFPNVVGNRLNVSTWAMLVFIIAGGIIWGVSGMILFIPFAGIFKIMSDHLEEWKAWNTLLSR